MPSSGRFHIRSKSKSNQEIILLTDDIETTISQLKSEAAERKALRGGSSSGWRSPLPRSRTEASSAPRTPSEAATPSGHSETPLTSAGIPRSATEGNDQSQGRTGWRGSRHGSDALRRQKTDDGSAIKEGEAQTRSAGADLAPGSPLSSRASSSQSRFSTVSEGTLARLPRFDISKFSLASAPVSPTVSAAPTPAHSQVNLPPPSPDVNEAGNACLAFITPKQIEGGVQTPFGWLISFLCSYQPAVRQRQQHLFIVRHDERIDTAQPEWRDSAQRPWDPPLSEKGKAHAFQVGARLRKEGVGIHRVVCSPYLRCVETAAEIVRALSMSDEELAQRVTDAKAITAKKPFAEQPPGGSLGYRQQLVGQLNKAKEEASEQQPNTTPEPPRPAQTAGKPAKPRAGKKAKEVKVRCHIEPGLCEIRTGATSAAPSAPQNQVLLPRQQLEALIPQDCLRITQGTGNFVPPSWPEDVTAGLHRLIGTGDRICEQYPQENIILVTHSEAVHASVMRCHKKANVYNIKFGAFLHMERTVYTDTEDENDRGVSPWKLVTKSGATGVYFSG